MYIENLIQYLIDLLSIDKLHCLDLMKKYYIPTGKNEIEYTTKGD